eukprot:GHVS01101522.1.p1 GENE.GHVS01101522.1~~GHVS01101522.1.p1  ORF type:complete len:477 (-),score=43.98 GHVS01101522.1:63-1493(-)
MKKLVGRVVVLLLACIWTGRVAEGKDGTLPLLADGITNSDLKVQWNLKVEGWPNVKTSFELYDCGHDKYCAKVQAQYAKVVAGLLSEGGMNGEIPLSLEELKKLTGLALKKQWLIPLGAWKSEEGKVTSVLMPAFEGMVDADTFLNKLKDGVAEGQNRLIDDLQIEEHLLIARALVEPLRAMHKDHTYHGDINLKNIMVLPPPSYFKMAKPETKLLLKGFNSFDDQTEDCQGRLDALELAMTFGDLPIDLSSYIKVISQNLFNLPGANPEVVLFSNLGWLASYGPIGGYKNEFRFWRDYVNVEKMEPGWKSMWMFTTLATLSQGKLSFDQMTDYLKDGAKVDKQFLDELHGYVRYLAETGMKQFIRLMGRMTKLQVTDNQDDLQKRWGYTPDKSFEVLVDKNVLYCAYKKKFDAKINKSLKYAFMFTLLFPAVANELKADTVSVDKAVHTEWGVYVKSLKFTDGDILLKYINVTEK